jgi:[ribosomal protein S5]-alanine N-acetyltransferase
MPILLTERLRLIPGTGDSLRAELRSPADLGEILGVRVPQSWPPELYDADAINWSLQALESKRIPPDWGLYYITALSGDGERPWLIGAGGYKGEPDDTGTAEIGYSVVTEHQRRGYAREAVEGWIQWAFSDPRVSSIAAHTLKSLTPSIRVLESAGFRYVRPEADAGEPDAIRYELSRALYEASRA